jgi:hypothetical protein
MLILTFSSTSARLIYANSPRLTLIQLRAHGERIRAFTASASYTGVRSTSCPEPPRSDATVRRVKFASDARRHPDDVRDSDAKVQATSGSSQPCFCARTAVCPGADRSIVCPSLAISRAPTRAEFSYTSRMETRSSAGNQHGSTCSVKGGEGIRAGAGASTVTTTYTSSYYYLTRRNAAFAFGTRRCLTAQASAAQILKLAATGFQASQYAPCIFGFLPSS